jgi:hypothetical protein
VEHGQVGVVSGRVHQPHHRPPCEALQRRLSGVGRAQLERGDTQAVSPLLGQMHHESLVAKDGEQVIDARPGQIEVPGDRRGWHRLGMSCQQSQHGQRLTGGWGIGHGVSVSAVRRSGGAMTPKGSG